MSWGGGKPPAGGGAVLSPEAFPGAGKPPVEGEQSPSPEAFPEIACVLAQVLLSTYYVLLLPWTFGVLSSILGGVLLGTSCSICG